MMHNWESVEKMVSEWEHQNIGDPFVYEDFKYDLDEFDNLPPVIPRFSFYLQLSLKPMIAHLKMLRDGQSVGSLRDETKSMIETTNIDLRTKE